MKRHAILRYMLPIVAYFSIYTVSLAAETTPELDILHLFGSENTPENNSQSFDFSSGASANSQCWATYSSLTWAFGEPVNTAGPRLRLTGGASRYSFNSLIEDAKSGVVPIANAGQTGFGEALAGYQANYGALWITALAGAAYDARVITPSGQTTQSFAPKTAVETWLNVKEHSWIAAHAAYSWSRGEYSGSLRFGLRALDIIDLGPEAEALGDAESSRAHGGGFLKLKYQDVEMTFSGGIEGNYEHASGYYGSLGVFRKF